MRASFRGALLLRSILPLRDDAPGFAEDLLEWPLRWLTANIGIHHVHHISSRVPYYRLPQVLKDFPELRQIGRIGFLESVRGVKLVLWDETQRRLISFREARALA